MGPIRCSPYIRLQTGGGCRDRTSDECSIGPRESSPGRWLGQRMLPKCATYGNARQVLNQIMSTHFMAALLCTLSICLVGGWGSRVYTAFRFCGRPILIARIDKFKNCGHEMFFCSQSESLLLLIIGHTSVGCRVDAPLAALFLLFERFCFFFTFCSNF